MLYAVLLHVYLLNQCLQSKPASHTEKEEISFTCARLRKHAHRGSTFCRLTRSFCHTHTLSDTHTHTLTHTLFLSHMHTHKQIHTQTNTQYSKGSGVVWVCVVVGGA